MGLHLSGRKTGWRQAALLSAGLLVLAGCDETAEFNPFKSRPEAADTDGDVASKAAVKLVERDVEAPEIFQVTDMGLWDGRPSLGGVWVAHPDVKEPERVIIRNTANSKFVIGALFRRERENPGPTIQISSDAAAALGLLAGAPSQLNVTALRREASEEPDPVPAPEAVATEELEAPEDIMTSSLDPVAGAAEAIATVESQASAMSIASAGSAEPLALVDPEPAQTPAAAKPAQAEAAAYRSPTQSSSLDKPYIQIGIFSVEQNANNTAVAMRQAGMVPTVKKQTAKGKDFWRVIVGPAANSSERSVLLKSIKGVGFDDAYPVTN